MKRPYLILEVGINHGGSFIEAKKIINHACRTNADAIKLQYFKPEDLYRIGSKNFESVKKLQLSDNHFLKLRKIVKKKKKDFGCSIFSFEGFNFVKKKLKTDFVKIASMDNNNFPLLKHVSKFNKKIIISLGMISSSELIKLRKMFKKNTKVSFLHCISNYPSKLNELNLINIKTLSSKLKHNIGYSDHSIGIDAIKTAYNLGATIIEKHFTDNKKKVGLDHSISADPKDISDFYKYLCREEIMAGKDIYKKNSLRPDHKNIKNFRRTVNSSIKNKKFKVRK